MGCMLPSIDMVNTRNRDKFATLTGTVTMFLEFQISLFDLCEIVTIKYAEHLP